MIPVAAKIFFGAVWKRALGLLGWIGRNPWPAACLILLLASLWLLHGRNEARDELAQRIAAEKSAAGAQKRVNDAAKVHYERKADEADLAHADMVAEAFDATAAFVARNRLQQDRTCKAPAAASDSGPELPAEVPARVVLDQADVYACANLYAYSAAAHEWAASLKLPENLLPEGTAESPPH